MDRGGRGNDDNADNCCYRGAMLRRRTGGKLGGSGTKKMMTFGRWQCGEGTAIDEDKKPYERAGRKEVDSSAETAIP